MRRPPPTRQPRRNRLWQLGLGSLIVAGAVWTCQAEPAQTTEAPVSARADPTPDRVAAPAQPAAVLIPEHVAFDAWECGDAATGVECPAGRSYTSGGWKVQVRPDGTIGPISFRDQVLMRQVFIHGRYETPGDAHDARFFQGSAGPGKPMLGWEDGPRVLLRTSGTLGNTRHPAAADYRQTIRLQPGGISCEVEATLLVPLSSHHHIFLSLAEIPISTLAGRGFRLLGGNVERRLAVVPPTYARETDIRQYGLRQFCAVIADGWLTIAAPEGSSIALSDTRSYNGQDIRIDVASSVPWLPQAVVHPAGSVFRWRWNCAFRPFPEAAGTP